MQYEGLPPEYEVKLKEIEALASNILKFLPRGIPNFPSHGIDHSQYIISYLDLFVKSWGITLSEKERYILYLSSWLHDIGNIVSREKHNEISAEIISTHEVFQSILNLEIISQVIWVVKSHSSSFEIDTVPLEREGVRLRFISALFRVMDSAEITYHKCPPIVYSLIKDIISKDNDSKEVWECHMSIVTIVFNCPYIIFQVNDSEKSKRLINHLKKEISDVEHVFKENKVKVPIVQTKEF